MHNQVSRQMPIIFSLSYLLHWLPASSVHLGWADIHFVDLQFVNVRHIWILIIIFAAHGQESEEYEKELCKEKEAGEWFRLVGGEGDSCRDVIQCTSSGLQAIRWVSTWECNTVMHFSFNMLAEFGCPRGLWGNEFRQNSRMRVLMRNTCCWTWWVALDHHGRSGPCREWEWVGNFLLKPLNECQGRFLHLHI